MEPGIPNTIRTGHTAFSTDAFWPKQNKISILINHKQEFPNQADNFAWIKDKSTFLQPDSETLLLIDILLVDIRKNMLRKKVVTFDIC